MNVEQRLTAMRDVIQQDVGNRGLACDPDDNLLTACPDDFAAACKSLAETPNAYMAIITGFLIPTADPPSGETDGPLGAIFLARALVPLGIRIRIITDSFCRRALEAGVAACGLEDAVLVATLPPASHPWQTFLELDWRTCLRGGLSEKDDWRGQRITHLLALERVGPSHTTNTMWKQPGATEEIVDEFHSAVSVDHQARCHTMRGRDITELMSPAHLVFEETARAKPPVVTIGIGDGGNEIGMGKIPWRTIQRNIPNGGLIACRVPTDYLIVAGVSNWGGYALAAGVALLRGKPLAEELFDVDREREILRVMVEAGPLVDGVTGKPTVSVDGLSFEEYVKPLRRLAKLT